MKGAVLLTCMLDDPLLGWAGSGGRAELWHSGGIT